MPPVTHDWFHELPFKQQSILFSGLRGPDRPGCPSIKRVNRWLRMVSQHNADPAKEYMRQEPLPDPLEVCEELEFLTCHYVHHFADALAVVAYGHPEFQHASYAARVHFRIAEELFHFEPEPPETFRLRHRDRPWDYHLSPTDPRAEIERAWDAQQRDAFETYVDEAVAR